MPNGVVIQTSEGSFDLSFGWSNLDEVILVADGIVDGVLQDLPEHWVVETRDDVVAVLVEHLGATSEQAEQTADAVWEDGSAWARDQYRDSVVGNRRRRWWRRRR